MLENWLKYCTALNVKPTASLTAIKKAHRSLAKKYHPDKNAGDLETAKKFLEIQEAAEFLCEHHSFMQSLLEQDTHKIERPASKEKSKPNGEFSSAIPKAAIKPKPISIRIRNHILFKTSVPALAIVCLIVFFDLREKKSTQSIGKNPHIDSTPTNIQVEEINTSSTLNRAMASDGSEPSQLDFSSDPFWIKKMEGFQMMVDWSNLTWTISRPITAKDLTKNGAFDRERFEELSVFFKLKKRIIVTIILNWKALKSIYANTNPTEVNKTVATFFAKQVFRQDQLEEEFQHSIEIGIKATVNHQEIESLLENPNVFAIQVDQLQFFGYQIPCECKCRADFFSKQSLDPAKTNYIVDQNLGVEMDVPAKISSASLANPGFLAACHTAAESTCKENIRKDFAKEIKSGKYVKPVLNITCK